MLSDYEVLSVSGFQLHSVRKRDVHTQSNLERLVSFRALQRYRMDSLTPTPVLCQIIRNVPLLFVIGAFSF